MTSILFISKGLINQTGGAETAAFNILRSILQTPTIKEIVILTNEGKKNDKDNPKIRELFSISEKKVHVLLTPLLQPRVPIYTDYWDARRFKANIKYILSRWTIDLIHIHAYSTFYIIPEKAWKVPILYSFHDYPIKWPDNPINFVPFNFMEKLWAIIARRYWHAILSRNLPNVYFHCNGSDSYEYLVRRGVKTRHVLQLINGYNSTTNTIAEKKPVSRYLQKLAVLNRYRLKVLSVGQFNSVKNQYRLVQGFVSILKQGINAILILVGPATPIVGSFYLRKIFKNLEPQYKDRVLWLGYVSQALLNELYQMSDVVILMSHSEASPLILSECVNFGKLLLSTKVGALIEYLPRDFTKLESNSPTSLTLELEKLVKSDGLLEKSTDIMKRVKLPSWNNVGKVICAYYVHMLDESSVRFQ